MQSVVCRLRLVESTAEHGRCECRKLDTPTENSLGTCTREDVGKMRSDCPERATHNILEGARLAVGQWKIQVLAKPAHITDYTTSVRR